MNVAVQVEDHQTSHQQPEAPEARVQAVMTESTDVMMAANEVEAKAEPRYDFVGIAG